MAQSLFLLSQHFVSPVLHIFSYADIFSLPGKHGTEQVHGGSMVFEFVFLSQNVQRSHPPDPAKGQRVDREV